MTSRFPSCLVWRTLILFVVYALALSVPMLWAMDRNESPRILKAFASAKLKPELDIIQVRLSEQGGMLNGRITLRSGPTTQAGRAYLLKLKQDDAEILWAFVESGESAGLRPIKQLSNELYCFGEESSQQGSSAGRSDGIHIDFALPLDDIDYSMPLSYSARSLSLIGGVDGCPHPYKAVDFAPHPRAPEKTIHPIALTNRLCDGRY